MRGDYDNGLFALVFAIAMLAVIFVLVGVARRNSQKPADCQCQCEAAFQAGMEEGAARIIMRQRAYGLTGVRNVD